MTDDGRGLEHEDVVDYPARPVPRDLQVTIHYLWWPSPSDRIQPPWELLIDGEGTFTQTSNRRLLLWDHPRRQPLRPLIQAQLSDLLTTVETISFFTLGSGSGWESGPEPYDRQITVTVDGKSRRVNTSAVRNSEHTDRFLRLWQLVLLFYRLAIEPHTIRLLEESAWGMETCLWGTADRLISALGTLARRYQIPTSFPSIKPLFLPGTIRQHQEWRELMDVGIEAYSVSDCRKALSAFSDAVGEAESLAHRDACLSDSLDGLAGVHYHLGEFPAATELLDRAIAHAIEVFGPIHVYVANLLDHQERLLLRTGRTDEASSLERRIVEIWKNGLGRDARM